MIIVALMYGMMPKRQSRSARGAAGEHAVHAQHDTARLLHAFRNTLGQSRRHPSRECGS